MKNKLLLKLVSAFTLLSCFGCSISWGSSNPTSNASSNPTTSTTNSNNTSSSISSNSSNSITSIYVSDGYEDTLHTPLINGIPSYAKTGHESTYGSDVSISFYTPVLENDPYENVDKDSFYENYHRAKSYEESYYRSQHGLISGLNIENDDYLPPNSRIPNENGRNLRSTSGHYVLTNDFKYISYTAYNLDNTYFTVYYGGAYTSLTEVATYLLAFGEVPVNNKYGTSNSRQSLEKWGIYGRLNQQNFSGDTNKYPYEPLLKNIRSLKYTETDFGTIGGYKCGNVYEPTYNTGVAISRGAARLTFVSDTSVKNIDERYVFYTYNHYNDFQEYLNYDEGWGKRFGNETAGNPYCYSSSDFKSTYADPTEYPEVYFNTILYIQSKA